MVGSVPQWLGCRSLACRLSLLPIYHSHVTISWVNCPLWVSQLGQLSLPFFWGR